MNRILKRIIIVLNLIFLIPILTACTGGKEVNELAIVIAVGMDMDGGKVVLTNEIINPAASGHSEKGTTQESTIFVQGVGDTFEEAMADIQLSFNKDLYFAHNYIAIFGEEIARKDFGTYMDILTRGIQQRESAYIIVAKGANAYDIMGTDNKIGASPAKSIRDGIKKKKERGKGASLTVHDFFKKYYEEEEGFNVDVAEIVKKPEIDKSKDKSEKEVLHIEGGGVVKHNKLIGYLTGQEMLGLNFIKGNIKSGIISFKVPERLIKDHKHTTDNEKKSSFRVFRSKTKKELKIMDGKLHLHLDVITRGVLTEVTQNIDISQPQLLDEMEKECAKEVKTIIVNTMDRAQKEFNLDIFNIGGLVHRKHPKLWKEIRDDWEKIFTDLDYTISVEIDIEDTGFTNAPPNIRKEK